MSVKGPTLMTSWPSNWRPSASGGVGARRRGRSCLIGGPADHGQLALELAQLAIHLGERGLDVAALDAHPRDGQARTPPRISTAISATSVGVRPTRTPLA